MIITTQDRFEKLIQLESTLKADTHHHMALGGHVIGRELPQVKAAIFAQVYGILSDGVSHDISRRAFRWLLAHADESRVSYNPKKGTNQWKHIMEYYFRKFHGHYAEVALLERILLSLFKNLSTDPPLSDMFIADRSADHYMMSDWIMHQQMTHGTLHMGVQLSTGRGSASKLTDLHNRELHDREFLGQKGIPKTVHDFLRHNTAILSFPRFKTAQENRIKALRFLMSGSPRYQSQQIATTGNKTFNEYGRQVMEVLRFFHAGILDRVIDHRKRLKHHDFSSDNERGETVSCSIYQHGDIPIATVRIQEPSVKTSLPAHKPRFSRVTPIAYSVPIHPEFLDLYRDMAGVPAQS